MKEYKQTVSFAIEQSLLDKVDALAKDEMVNRSIVIRKALVAYLGDKGVEV